MPFVNMNGMGDSMRRTYFPQLDGLRAISILAVLSFHTAGPILGTIFGPNGWLGVNFFFVISGFLITNILMQEWSKSGRISFKNFYIRRLLRIAPAFYFRMLVAGLFTISQKVPTIPALIVASLYLADYDLALNLKNVLGSGLEFTWSLAVEEKFYFLWPLTLLLFNRKLTSVVIALIAFCITWKMWLIQQNVSWLRISGAFDTRFDCILWGCVASLIWSRPDRYGGLHSLLSKPLAAPTLLGILWLIMHCAGTPMNAVTHTKSSLLWLCAEPLFNVVSAALVLATMINSQSIVSRFMSTRPLVWIGKLSYSLYLWHTFALLQILAHPELFKHLNPVGLEFSAITGSFSCAAVSYYLVEKPFLKLKSSFAAKQSDAATQHSESRTNATIT